MKELLLGTVLGSVMSTMIWIYALAHGDVKGCQCFQPTTATLVQFTGDSDVILDEFLLEQRLRDPFMLPPTLQPMPTPRYIPPVYLYQQIPCP